MAIKKVFKCYIPSLNYVTQKGRTCVFQEGRFITDHVEEVAELTQMVNDKSNPHIYIDPDESEIDTTLQERIKEAQIKATLEVMAEHNQGKAGNQGTSKIEPKAAQVAHLDVVQPASMSAATLLGIQNHSAAMAVQSNQK